MGVGNETHSLAFLPAIDGPVISDCPVVVRHRACRLHPNLAESLRSSPVIDIISTVHSKESVHRQFIADFSLRRHIIGNPRRFRP